MTKRTVLRSSKGKKLYAVRGAGGRFKDIQSFKRAHAADMRKRSKAEKRDVLAIAICAFAKDIGDKKVGKYVAFKNLWAKINALKLF